MSSPSRERMQSPDYQLYNATLVWKRAIHPGLLRLRVRPDDVLSHARPGQYITLGLGAWEAGGLAPEAGGLARTHFSLSSPILDPETGRLLAPGTERDLELYLSLDRSPLTRCLFGKQPGDRLWIDPLPAGEYELGRLSGDENLLFLATGTGEAPHNRMILHLLRTGHRGRIASVVSCRQRRDLGYRDVHERLTTLFPRYTYVPITTRDTPGPRRHIQDLLLCGELEREIGFALHPEQSHVYVCGHPAMVGRPVEKSGRRTYPAPSGVIEILERRHGFRAAHPDGSGTLHFETF
ncbi:MAG: ferredoxin--NADP reductase [Acidobacteriota bacterium]